MQIYLAIFLSGYFIQASGASNYSWFEISASSILQPEIEIKASIPLFSLLLFISLFFFSFFNLQANSGSLILTHPTQFTTQSAQNKNWTTYRFKALQNWENHTSSWQQNHSWSTRCSQTIKIPILNLKLLIRITNPISVLKIPLPILDSNSNLQQMFFMSSDLGTFGFWYWRMLVAMPEVNSV